MKYLEYLLNIFYGFIISYFIFILVVLLQLGSPTESSRWISEIYDIKSDIAASLESPKIVVVSGSNALFGISCATIKEQMKIDCLNGGTHAGLGIKYILHRSKNWLQPGDTVILPLEYHHYYYNGDINNQLIDYILSRDPQHLLNLTWSDRIYILTSISFERVSRGISARFKPNPPWKSFYKSENLNKYGDETTNLASSINSRQKQAVSTAAPQENLGSIKNTKGLQAIKEFVEYCRQNKIKVLATWPNTLWFDVYEETKQQEWRDIQNFYQSINVDILGKPKDFMYSSDFFYDTTYHLNDIGVKQRTQQLIDLLFSYQELNA